MPRHISTTEFLRYESQKFSLARNAGIFGDQVKSTGIPSEVKREKRKRKGKNNNKNNKDK